LLEPFEELFAVQSVRIQGEIFFNLFIPTKKVSFLIEILQYQTVSYY